MNIYLSSLQVLQSVIKGLVFDCNLALLCLTIGVKVTIYNVEYHTRIPPKEKINFEPWFILLFVFYCNLLYTYQINIK